MKRLFAVGLLALLWAATASSAVIKTIQAGATDQTVVIKIIDSTDGTPETGVAFNTSGIDLEYWRHGANSVVDITEATQTVSGAHTDGGFVALGNGYYRLDLPDAAVASGATAVEVMGTVTGMIVIGGTVDLSPPVNAVALGGTAQTGRDIGASVLLSSGTGTGQLSITSGIASVNATQWGGTAVATARPLVDVVQISGDSAAADTLEAAFDATATGARLFGIDRLGTAASVAAGTITLDAAAAYGDNTLAGATIWGCGSTQGYCQFNTVASNVGSTDVLTLSSNWPVTPSGTVTYYLYGTAASSGGGLDAAGVRAAVGLASANLDTQLGAIDDYVDTEVAAIKTKSDFLPSATAGASGGVFIAGTNAATTITTALTTTFTGNLTGSAGSVTGAVGSVTGNVGGNVTGSVGSVATGGITAASIATDAIGAAEIASDAGTELGTATWATTTRTLSAGTNIVLAKGTGITGFNDLDAAAVRTAIGLATANLDTQLSTIDTVANSILDDTGTAGVVVASASKTGYELSAAGVDAIWDEPKAGHVTANTYGVYLDAAVSGVSTGGVSAGDIADAVLDEALSGHQTAGTAGKALSDAAAGGGGGLDAAGVRAAVGLASANLDTQLAAKATSSALTSVANAIAALNDLSADDVGALLVEDQGGGVSLRCALAAILAYAGGDLTTAANAPTFRDPSGSETRIAGTISSAGNRSMTITCPSY